MFKSKVVWIDRSWVFKKKLTLKLGKKKRVTVSWKWIVWFYFVYNLDKNNENFLKSLLKSEISSYLETINIGTKDVNYGSKLTKNKHTQTR